jgi:amidohydrolase
MRESRTFGLSENELSDLIRLRKEIHSRPELSEEEERTSERVVEQLRELDMFHISKDIGGHGVLASYDSHKPGRTVLFRAELDALPIQEESRLKYRSEVKGVSHACGHDGHLSILIGLAKLIKAQGIEKGRLILLFQPAEEIGKGAFDIMNAKEFQQINPDWVFAIHNLPGYPLGQVVLKEGPFTASVISMIIKLKGKTSHAAEPEFGINPAQAVAEIIKESHFLMLNEPKRDDFSVVVPVFARLGETAYGTSPGEAEVHFTIRSWTEGHLQKRKDELRFIAESSGKKHKLQVDISLTDHFNSNQNDSEAISYVRTAARQGNYEVENRAFPFKWGEDFGLFTQKFRGAMFGLGAGLKHATLHNPDYDFPDELIPIGADLFYRIYTVVQDN